MDNEGVGWSREESIYMMEFELVLEEWEGYGQVEDGNKDILSVCVEVGVGDKDNGRKNVETGQQ